MRYIQSYIHNHEIGVLIELETPYRYAMQTDEFEQLARDLAVHIAATNPLGIHKEDTVNVSPLRFKGEAPSEDNTPLLLQQFIKDPSVTVAQKIHAVAGQLESAIEVLRFVRFSISDM
ncbi:MAG: elongation factor Ts [Pseudohongiellaceae bacterium]|jgi:elongation factor Ts